MTSVQMMGVMMCFINIFATFLELKVMMNNSTTIWVGRYNAIPVVHPTPSVRLQNDGSYQKFCHFFRVESCDE